MLATMKHCVVCSSLIFEANSQTPKHSDKLAPNQLTEFRTDDIQPERKNEKERSLEAGSTRSAVHLVI